jgi:hypothetical protein
MKIIRFIAIDIILFVAWLAVIGLVWCAARVLWGADDATAILDFQFRMFRRHCRFCAAIK